MGTTTLRRNGLFYNRFMNKGDLIGVVHEKLGGAQKAAEDVVNGVFETITNSLAKGEEVSIAGFGTFAAKKRGARTGVNPRTGEKIQIAATVVPKFRAGEGLKDAVK